MEYIIRPINVRDAEDINQMRRMQGVFENTFGLESERIDYNLDFIASLGDESHVFVAEVSYDVTDYASDENISYSKWVIGACGMHISKIPRKRHSASIGIMVHKEHQGKKIGTKLLSKVVDLADNWLMLKRLELSVFADNEKAIKLYKKFNFEIEGKKTASVIRNGAYADELFMARIIK